MPPGSRLVMGVLNVTPDSFSDGGRWLDRDAAIGHGVELFAQGADIVDVGGESTRPGAEPVSPADEANRVVAVVEALAGHGRVSIDTRHRAVAEAAIEAGATLVNDVSASLASVAAEAGVGWVAMHMLGSDPRTMQESPSYDDVVGEVGDYLAAKAGAARELGVAEVWIDPGIGFGKTFAHNLSLLRHLRRIVEIGEPVVVGTSRKGFVRTLCGVSIDDVRSGRDIALEGSLATAVAAMNAGAAMVRVHDVAATVQAARIVAEPADAGEVAA